MDASSPLLVLLGALLTVVGGAAVLPQVVRTWRTGDGDGLSVGTCFLAFGGMLAWCTYTSRIEDWPAFAGSVAPAVGWALVILAATWRGILTSRSTLLAGALMAGVVSSLALLEQDGVAAMLLGASWAVPQAVRACRSRDLSGVSPLTWTLLALENVGWVLYGTVSGHWLYVPASLAQVAVMGIVLTRLGLTRRPAPPVPDLPTQRTGLHDEAETVPV